MPKSFYILCLLNLWLIAPFNGALATPLNTAEATGATPTIVEAQRLLDARQYGDVITLLTAHSTVSQGLAEQLLLAKAYENVYRFNKAAEVYEQALTRLTQQPAMAHHPVWLAVYGSLIANKQELSDIQSVRTVEKARRAWINALPADAPWLTADTPIPLLSMAQLYCAKADVAYRHDKPIDQVVALLEQAKAVALPHEFIPVSLNLAIMAAHAGDVAKAAAAYNGIMQVPHLDDQNPYLLAKLYATQGGYDYYLGRLDSAKAYLNKALSYQAKMPLGIYLGFMRAEFLLRAMAKIPTGDNYVKELADVPQDPGRPVYSTRWHDDTKTLRVYMPSGEGLPGWQPHYATLVPYALNTWNAALNNRFNLVYTTDATQPYDISITWKPRSQSQAFINQKNTPPWLFDTTLMETLGENRITHNGQHYLANRLMIYLADSLGHSRPDRLMKGVLLHEIGHAMGLTGHSRLPGDVMFESADGTAPITLSARDIKSIQTLYGQKTQITNQPGQSVSQYAKGFGFDWANPR